MYRFFLKKNFIISHYQIFITIYGFLVVDNGMSVLNYCSITWQRVDDRIYIDLDLI